MAKPAAQRGLELLARCSLPTQYRLAGLLAAGLRLAPNRISRQTRENIELCFGDRPREWRERLYRDSIRHTCNAMTELAAVWCWPVDDVLARITREDVCAEFERAGRGRIVLAPHLGSWELLALWLSRRGNAMFLYKHRESPALDRFIFDARARAGGLPVSTRKQGLRQLLKGLKSGGTLMILPDQRPRRSKAQIESTLFGVSAPTTTVVHNLCSKVACDVFIATIYRSTPPGEFGLRVEPLEHARLAAEPTASAQYLNDRIEQLVADYIDQYQWGYRRFAKSAYESTGQGN